MGEAVEWKKLLFFPREAKQKSCVKIRCGGFLKKAIKVKSQVVLKVRSPPPPPPGLLCVRGEEER